MMNEFRKRICKINSTRKHKVTNSRGVYDAYKWIRKNKWLDIGSPVSEHEFYTIIRLVNNCLADSLIAGEDIIFPHRMGSLELRKYPARISFKGNKLITNLPVDWNKTLELWATDKDSFLNKTLIRTEDKELFKILYNKEKANYINLSFMVFDVNRYIKKSLKDKIKNKLIDAYSI